MGWLSWREDRVKEKISELVTLLQADYPKVSLDIDQVYSHYRNFNMKQIHHLGKLSAALFYVLRETHQPYTCKELQTLLNLDSVLFNYKRFLRFTGNSNTFNSVIDFIPRYSFYAGLDKKMRGLVFGVYLRNSEVIDSIGNAPSIKAKALIYFCCEMNNHSAVRGVFSDALRISDITMGRVAEKIGARVGGKE